MASSTSSGVPIPPIAELSLTGIKTLVTQPNLPPSSIVDGFADLELEASNLTVDEATSSLLSNYYTCYILALILEDNLYEARFLCQRFDKNLLQNDGLVISAFTLLRAAWSRDYVTFHQTISNAPWGDLAGVMATRVVEHHRRRTLNLLSHAYTSIPPSSAATYLGLASGDQAVQVLVEQHGWTYDQAQNLLAPARREELLPKNVELSKEEQAASGDTPAFAVINTNVAGTNGKLDVGRIAKLSEFVEKLSDG